MPFFFVHARARYKYRCVPVTKRAVPAYGKASGIRARRLPYPLTGKFGLERMVFMEQAAAKKWILAAAGAVSAISAAVAALFITRRNRRREAEELAAQIAMLIQ